LKVGSGKPSDVTLIMATEACQSIMRSLFFAGHDLPVYPNWHPHFREMEMGVPLGFVCVAFVLATKMAVYLLMQS
jgi:hypothetical protein